MSKRQRVVLASVGTTGDLAPVVRLAQVLCDQGVEPRIVCHPDLEPLVPSHIEHSCFQHPSGASLMGHRELADPNEPLLDRLRAEWTLLSPLVEDVLLTVLRASEYADAIIHSGAVHGATHVAERFGIPSIKLYLRPAWTTSQFPSPHLPIENMPSLMNVVSHLLVEAGAQLRFRRSLNRFRRDRLGLPGLPWGRESLITDGYRWSRYPTIFGIPSQFSSRTMLKNPLAHMVGFIRPPYAPPPEIPEVSDPLAYFGLGSAGELHEGAHAIAQQFGSAFSRCGIRAVISDVSELRPYFDDPILIQFSNLDEVLSRCGFAVHSGGSGIVGCSLRAACPMMIFPIWFDHSFWSYQCKLRGLAMDWNYQKPTPSDIDSAIKTAIDMRMCGRFRTAVDGIDLEDGAFKASSIILEVLGGGR